MSVDLTSEMSALSFSASASASGAVTPHHIRSHAGSGAVSPPSASEHPPGGHGASPDGGHAEAPVAHEEVDANGLFAKMAGGHSGARVNGTRHAGKQQLDPMDRRTIFIPNLPRDATHRELTNLFAFCEGFVKVQLYDGKDSSKEGAASAPIPPPGGSSPPAISPPLTVTKDGRELTNHGCFALFENAAQAALARARLDGYVFDGSASPTVVLQARVALKNLVLTREEQEAAAQQAYSNKTSRRSSMTYSSALQQQQAGGNGIASLGVDSPFHVPLTGLSLAAGNGAFSPLGALSPQPQQVAYGIHSGYASPALGPYSHAQQLTPPALAVQNGAGFYSDSAMHNGNGVFGALYQSNANGYAQHQHPQHPQQHGGPNGGGFAHPQQHGARHHHGHGHGHGHSQAGPNNPPCTTLFLARLDLVSDEDLLSLLFNTFGAQVVDSKLMLDSRGQRIAFVEFDSIESSSAALPRIHGYMGLSCAFSKNPLNKRLN